MTRLAEILLVTISSSSSVQSLSSQTSDVVNHAFCESSVSAHEMVGKKNLEEVHTYAELKEDKRADLPDSFTICSTIMKTTCCRTCPWPSFFAILDDNDSQFLAACRNHGDVKESKFQILYPEG